MWTGGLFWGVLGRMGRVYKAKRKNVTWLATHGCGESSEVQVDNTSTRIGIGMESQVRHGEISTL